MWQTPHHKPKKEMVMFQVEPGQFGNRTQMHSKKAHRVQLDIKAAPSS